MNANSTQTGSKTCDFFSPALRPCSECKQLKGPEGFYTRKEPKRMYYSCKACRCEAAKKTYHLNPEKARAICRKTRLKKKYNLTVAEYERIFIEQGGKCAICKRAGDTQFCVDHCHKTGIVRGILCRECNLALGNLRESLDSAQSLIEYIKRHSS